MQQTISQKIRVYAARNRHRRILRKFVQALACVVVFCTTYALILPAITMEKEAFCGVEEHIHTEACYGAVSETRLVCSAEALQLHTHSDGCYDAAGALCCGQADYVIHSHAEGCYDVENNLICTIAERGAHVHTDSCYLPVETQPAVLHVHSESCNVSRMGQLLCTTEETEGHAHGDSCYVPGTELVCSTPENHVHGEGCFTYPMICNLSTEPHVHNDSCLSRGELVCTVAEEDHTHDDSCYDILFTCGKNEGDAHVHGDGCYSTEPEQICDIPENHVHSDACYAPELNCEIPETPGHAHGDECYEWITEIGCGLEEGQEEPTEPVEPVLACTQSAAQVHIHGDGCFETVAVEAMPICGNTEEGHEHSSECYNLTCGAVEHTHNLACWSNPEADLETAEQWKATFAEVELTGKWPEDVVAIAETQLGYTESSSNYAVWEDNTTHGYTRYGAWYGSPYGDWCAMFTSFCLHYAEVEGMPLHWGVRPWIEELTELKLYHEAEVYEPKAGDVIFYDWECDGLSDHVGIVAEIIVPEQEEGEDQKPVQVKAIEGNSSNRVQYVYYDIDDDRILGYSELPENPDVYSCGILRHIHNEYCYDEEENFICQQLEHQHTETCEPRDTLYCGLEEHVHIETCYDEAGELLCQLREHSHNEDCTVEQPDDQEPVYYCGAEEHTHAETCYDEAGELVCELTEHTHSEKCTVEPVTYYCGLEEHTHIETCYDEAGELVCELTEHTHGEECTVEPVTYYCGLEEHTHIETCYDEAGELVCELTEHTHSEECTVESVTYYCGMEEHIHVETCYNEAGELVCELTEHTHTEECTVQSVYYCGLEEHTHIETCYNEAEELVCNLTEHTHSSLCTVIGGYVCGLEEHLHDENCYDNEGNLTCTLPEHTHSDECKARNIYACNMVEHTHSETCYDEAGNLICTLPEHIHTTACIGRSLYYSDASIRVHAVIRGVENLPGKLLLNVVPITPETYPEAFGDLQSAVSQQMTDQSQYISTASFYDLQLLSDGAVYTLPETALVTVTMEFTTPIFDAEAVENSVGTHAFLLTPEGGETVIPVEGGEEEIPEITPEEPAEPSLVESVISTISDAVSGLIPEASATEMEGEGEGEEEPQKNDTLYNVSPLTGENYGSQNEGITSVTFEASQLDIFGVALASEPEIPEYWTRVNGFDDLDSGETYLIVSAEGNYALTNANNNYVPVRLQATRGKGTYIDEETGEKTSDSTYNNVYYQIDIANNATKTYTDVGASQLWTITKNTNGNMYTIGNGSTTYLNLDSSVFGISKDLTLSYNTPENCWRINNSYYLRNTGTGSFSRGDDTTDSTTYYSDGLFYTRDMLIFKASDVTEVTEPPLIIQNTTSSGSNATVSKPAHKVDAEKLSDPQTGNTAYGGISGTYDSDPATSSIEDEFYEGGDYAKQKENDGMVRSDKSVVYGKDDYGALQTHIENTFGVTLSALGQAYPIPSEDNIVTPIDVVFVLDTSSSMTSNDTGGTTKRVEAMTDALNKSIDHIMVSNDYNRVGVVVYSRGTDKILPMGRYDTDNSYEKYTCGKENHKHSISCGGRYNCDLEEHSHTSSKCQTETFNAYFVTVEGSEIDNGKYGNKGTITRIQGAPTLRTEGAAEHDFANAGINSTQGWGTYTQAGIAMGYDVFEKVKDTTFVTTIGEGTDLERTYYIQRQPVYILLSDGEPTYSTNIYNDVLNGPHYGDGNGEIDNFNENNRGIHGYYTILSGNYYKHMASVHYKKQAKFYTVGMGINSPELGDGPMTENDNGNAAGDNYRRAVLNPENINNLSSSIRPTYTTENLKDLLLNDFSDQSYPVRAHWPEITLGEPHKYLPALQPNPYYDPEKTDAYDYADYSEFGVMDSSSLTSFFSTVIDQSQISVPYGFVLYKNTKVEIDDYIGAGMEVETDPILRYNGQNYTYESKEGSLASGTVTYTYNPTNETDANAQKIQAKITTVDFEPIYMCGMEQHIHDDRCEKDGVRICGIEHGDHTHNREKCGVLDTYLCGEHTHVRTCHVDDDMSKPLKCGYTHDHKTAGCTQVTTTQKVELIVPDKLLPLYSPNLVNTDQDANKFYYEALPVRLIYRVGMTDDAEIAVLNLAETGGTLTFYSNRWGGTQHAQTDLTPSTVNPFYHDQKTPGGTGYKYQPHEDKKQTNQTGTDPNATHCHWASAYINGDAAGHVYHELGNNGKLTFKADTVDIPVEKQWKDLQGNVITDQKTIDSLGPVGIGLYLVQELTNDERRIEQIGDEVILNSTQCYDTDGTLTCKLVEHTHADPNDWKHVFKNLPDPVYSICPDDCLLMHSHTVDAYYVIAETTIPEGHLPEYSANNNSFGNVISVSLNSGASANVFRVKTYGTGCYAPNGSLTCTNTEEGHEHSTHVLVTVTNTPSVELPNTGGSGTTIYYALGILLCSLSCAAYIFLQSKKIYRERG